MLIKFQDGKMTELQRTVDRLNQSVEKSPFKVMIKTCSTGGQAFTVRTEFGAVGSPDPFAGMITAISGALGVVCNVVEVDVN